MALTFSAGVAPLCRVVHIQAGNQRPLPSHRCISPSLLKAPPGLLLPTPAEPEHVHMSLVTLHRDNFTPAAQRQWGQLSFLLSKGRVSSSYSPAGDHNFLLSPQKRYFPPGIFGSSFHLRTMRPCSSTSVREGEQSVFSSSLGAGKAVLTWAVTAGHRHSLQPVLPSTAPRACFPVLNSSPQIFR